MIESEATLSLKLNNLIINKGEGDIWIPLDDISTIVIDNLHISLTARMLSTLAEKNIAVFLSNKEHLPIGFFSSFDNHSRMSKTIGYQIEKNKEYYNLFWKLIVESKIANQQKVLTKLEFGDEIVVQLKTLSEEVRDGDTTNREAHAAKIYFNTLMDSTFSRGNDSILLNSGLDYGYTIVRAYMARCCVGYGLNTQLGIHHCNEYNRFNLVDDLIEPVRPFVDFYMFHLLQDEDYFTQEHRRKAVNMLNHKVIYNSKKMFLCNMLEEYIEQFAAMLSGKRENVMFPDVDGYQELLDEV